MLLKNKLFYLVIMLLVLCAFFSLNVESALRIFMKSIHYPSSSSPIFALKLRLIQINLICILFLLFMLRISSRTGNFIRFMINEMKIYFNRGVIMVMIIIFFQAGILLKDLLDMEQLLYERISGCRIMLQENVMPNNAMAADLHLPADFSQFINDAQKEIPLNANILYLGVERYAANYFLYPRKVYQPPEYEWINAETSEILKSTLVHEKNISFLIRKYRPQGYLIERISP